MEQGRVEKPAMHAALWAREVPPELGGAPDCSHYREAATRPSVVAVEFGERFGRRAEFNDIAAPRGLDGVDGGSVGRQRPEIRPAACHRLFEGDADGLVDG